MLDCDWSSDVCSSDLLDGGHLMYYLFEGLTGRPVSDVWLARLQRGGIAVLLAMMSVALFNDVARLLGLH
jgi:regulator of sigma E protease